MSEKSVDVSIEGMTCPSCVYKVINYNGIKYTFDINMHFYRLKYLNEY